MANTKKVVKEPKPQKAKTTKPNAAPKAKTTKQKCAHGVENLITALEHETVRLQALKSSAEKRGNKKLVEQYSKGITLNNKLLENMKANTLHPNTTVAAE